MGNLQWFSKELNFSVQTKAAINGIKEKKKIAGQIK